MLTPEDAARRFVCWMAEGWTADQVRSEAIETARLLQEAASSVLPNEGSYPTRTQLAARLQEWLRVLRLLEDRSQDVVYRNRLDPVFAAWREQRRALPDGVGTTHPRRSGAWDAVTPDADLVLDSQATGRLRLWAQRHGLPQQSVLHQLIAHARMDEDGRISVQPFTPHARTAHLGTHES